MFHRTLTIILLFCQVSAANGTQYLLQSDDKNRMQDWYQTLERNIKLLVSDKCYITG